VDLRLGVAGGARLRCPFERIAGVAGYAIGRPVLARQLERRQVVVEPGQAGQGAAFAVVLGVATPALRRRGQHAVQGVVPVELLADAGVAAQAARRHRFAAPRRHVAGGAGAAEFRVRVDAAQGDVAVTPGVERPGAEHAPAADEAHDGDGGQGEQRDGCPPGETTRAAHGTLLTS
jgi:hypothetical protein